jgi:Flp pilus assembly protein TadG
MATLRFARGPRSERGSQLIEFALVLPLLLLVVLGIMDFGLLFQRYEAVTNAAREGARIAVLQGYGDTDVQNRVQQYLSNAGLSGTPITIVLPDQAVSANGSCFTVTGATVFYPNQYLFLGGIMSYFGGASFGSKMVSATSMMRYEGPARSCT